MSGIFYVIGGANYEKNESLIIDLDIIKETKKKEPSVLLIAVACNDDSRKIEQFINYYEKFNVNITVLDSCSIELNTSTIADYFNKSDIIYFTGGLTYRLVQFVNKYNLQKELKNAYLNGKIIVGVSAGAIMLFDYGFGDKDAYTYNLETVNHRIVEGCGLLNGIFCPHYQNNGLLSFNEEVKKYNFNGYALENGSALKIENDGFWVLKSKGCCAFRFLKENEHKLQYLTESHFYNECLIK